MYWWSYCLWKLQNGIVWFITQAIIRLFGRGHDLSIIVFFWLKLWWSYHRGRCRRGWHGTVMCSSTTQGRHLRHLLSTFHHCNLTPPPPPSVQDIRRKQFSLVSIACSLHCVDHQSKDTDEFLSQKLTIPKLKFCQPSVWYALNMCMYPGWVRKHIVREGLTLISTICVQSGNVSQRLTCAVSYAVRWHQPSFNICSCTLCTYTELYIITVLLAFIITCSTSAKIANLTIMTAGYLQGMLPMYFWTPMCFVCALYVKA